MKASTVRSKKQAGVCTVTLDHPENSNALSVQLTTELVEALDAAEADSSIRVIVLTNTGNTFCAGADLAERAMPRGQKPAQQIDPALLFARFHRSSKPFVGKIGGHCVAGGMGIAAAMDYAVAVDTAKMGFTEVRIGVIPALVSVLCLPKMRAGDARAALLRGNLFLAPEAVRIGLINAAVPAQELDAAVDQVVEDLVRASPAALAAVKQLLVAVPSMDTTEAFEWTAALSRELFDGDDAKEGIAAFLAKRPAAWIPEAHRR